MSAVDSFWKWMRWIGLGFTVLVVGTCSAGILKGVSDASSTPSAAGEEVVSEVGGVSSWKTTPDGKVSPAPDETVATGSGAPTTLPNAPATRSFGTTPTPIAKPVQSEAAKNVLFEECKAKLKSAVSLNLLTDMSFDGGRPRVVVGRTWHNLPFEGKEGFAKVAACFFLAGDTSQSIRFEITDHMTGKVVATWKWTHLEVE